MDATHSILNKLVLLLLALFLSTNIYTQSLLQKKISVEVENTSIVNAIKQIGEVSEINFTYNPSILPNKLISASYSNKSINYILYTILDQYNIGFDELSGQIILYRVLKKIGNKIGKVQSDKNLLETGSSINLEKRVYEGTFIDTNNFSEDYIDTVFVNVYDTVFLTDTVTLVKTETVVQIDTVMLIRPDNSTIFDDIYNSPPNFKSKPWISIDLLGSYQFSVSENITTNEALQYNNEISGHISASNTKGYSFLAKVNFQFSNFSIQTGLGYNSIFQDFEFIDRVKGGYFEKYIADSIYTVNNTQDTTWQYFEKERWIETMEIFKTNSSINHNYLQLPLLLGYSINYKKFTFDINAGVFAELPLNRNQYVFFDTVNTDRLNVDTLVLTTQKPGFSMFVSLSASYLIAKNLSLVVQPYYYMNLQSVYSNKYAFNQRYSYPSLYIGVRYYFNKGKANKKLNKPPN